MMLKEERHTPHAVAFKVDLEAPAGAEEPEIKKRLEAYASNEGELLSREAIAEKLKRAEEKRKQALLNKSGAASPIESEERRRRAKERKRAIDDRNLHHLKEKCERDIVQAEEKRKQTWEERRNKLRNHIAKVEKIREMQAESKQSSTEKMK